MKPNLDEVTPSEESKENEMRIEIEEEITPSNHGARSERQKPGFTPGPWFTKWNGAYGHMVYGSDGSGSAVAVVSGVAPGITTAQGKTNARLIAAAPALYEALKNITERNGRRECERYSTGIGSCFKQGRRVDAQFAAVKCCASCIANAALALVDGPQTKETK